MQAQKFLISGKVQGVYFRASTKQRATALGITGWVRNLDDGRVEVYACAEPQRLASLQDWLWQGPPNAKVEHVEVSDVPLAPHQQFTIT